LSDGTIENRLGFLSTLVRHGQMEIVEHVLATPFERIEIYGGQGVRTPKDRRAFDVSELNLVYASKLYTQGARPRGQVAEAAYWAPLIGPFVGARIEEVAQLRIEDVHRVNGSWCLRICDLGAEQNVKNIGSFRRVPLHETLIQSGFLKYVANQARAGAVRVFPSLSNDNANRIWSNALGKWWNRYIDGIGLSDPRLDYHAFRYSFRQQCTLCGIENETRDALTGHWVSNNDSGRTYMKAENRQYPYPKLVEAMKSLRYDELQVSHLFVDEPMAGVEEALLR
jgi:integrase